MNPAIWLREDPLAERLLWLDPRAAAFGDARVGDLPSLLDDRDLLVVNDAATLPASLSGQTEAGEPVEIRLASRDGDTWTAVLFGEGDWRTPTERRALPPALAPGARVHFGQGATGGDPRDAARDAAAAAVSGPARGRGRRPALVATVTALLAPRLLTLTFSLAGDRLLQAVYTLGRPVQYAYLRGELPLWAIQTGYASRPWAFEMPSAGRPLTWLLLSRLAACGVEVARLTHAAGLSSTGDPALDARFPLPERSDIPEATVRAVAAARARGGRVVAVGTSVVRAIEGRVAARGELLPGEATTDLRIGQGFQRRVVDGLLTGMHEPTASHYALLGAFAPRALLSDAYAHAARAGYLQHEFGDSNLILPGCRRP